MSDKPHQRSKASICLSSIMGLNKAIITEEKEPEIKNEINPADIEVNKTVTKSTNITKNNRKNEPMGFLASADLIANLINLIALPLSENKNHVNKKAPPLSEDNFEFGKFVLHFDAKRKEVWWSNATAGGLLINFGYATYDYFVDCWGNGEVVLYAADILNVTNGIAKAKQIKLVAHPEKYGGGTFLLNYYRFNLFPIDINLYPIENNTFVYGMNITKIPIPDAVSEINTHKPRVDYASNKSKNLYKLDNDYIPILHEALDYGGTINANDLKTVVATGRKLGSTYPIDFRIKPKPPLTEPLTVTFNGITPNQCIEIKIKGKSLRPPKGDISQIISNKLEAPALALNGDVTLRLSMDNKSPIYLLKEEKNRKNTNRVMKAGMLIGTK